MLAVVQETHGPPEVLVAREVPDPEPGEGELLIRVRSANVIFMDTMLRAGLDGFATQDLPVIPGNGVTGTVVAAGPGTDDSLLGEVVVSRTGGSGAYAELVAVDQDEPLVVPEGLDPDVALALLADGRTAIMAADRAEIAAADRVLVLAAAGGVGSLLVQLALSAGAEVAGAAGGQAKVAFVTAMGAHGLDYLSADWTAELRRIMGGSDVVLDGVGGEVGEGAFDLMAPGGRFVSYGMASGRWPDVDRLAAQRDVSIRRLEPDPKTLRTNTERALAAATAGELRPVIGQRFALGRAADAHRAIADRQTVGKTLLTVG